MKLTEAEMRMAYQIEATSQNAALNEIYMTWRYTQNQATKDTAESLLAKLRPPLRQGVHGHDPGGPDELPFARKGADRWGNAGGGQAAVRGGKTRRA